MIHIVDVLDDEFETYGAQFVRRDYNLSPSSQQMRLREDGRYAAGNNNNISKCHIEN